MKRMDGVDANYDNWVFVHKWLARAEVEDLPQLKAATVVVEDDYHVVGVAETLEIAAEAAMLGAATSTSDE